jgi:hypothetical protein
MKKIELIVSAISAALFASATAKADVYVSGSAGLGYVSGNSVSGVYNGAAMSFGLSSDLGNGVTVSTSAGISLDSNDSATLGSVNATGLSNLTFATGGATITVGGDVDIAGDGVGEVGGVAGDLVDEGGYNVLTSVAPGLTQEDGYGVSVTTAVGSGTLTASYILDTQGRAAAGATNNALTDATDTATGLQLSLPLGPLSATVGFASDDANSENVTGGEIAYTVAGMGTLTAGMSETSDTTDESTWGVTYSGSLGGASLKIGYTNASAGTTEWTRTEASVSQSIGAGASMFLDIQTASGSGATTQGTNIAIGTSFSF